VKFRYAPKTFYSFRIVYEFEVLYQSGHMVDVPVLTTAYPDGTVASHHPNGDGHRAQMVIGDVGVLIVSVFSLRPPGPNGGHWEEVVALTTT
jgi:hypothetical protein